MTLRDEWEAADHIFDDARATEHIDLRPYQADAIARINDCIARGVRRIMVQAATGAGKTHIASAMTAGYRTQNKPVIFIRNGKRHVRFTPESRHLQRTHRCPLWAKSGHASIQ